MSFSIASPITSLTRSSSEDGKFAAMAATALAGIITGSLAFASAVDVRTLLTHVSQGKEGCDLVSKHFQVWWPCGRDWMVPLILAASAAQGIAFRATKQINWVYAGSLLFCIGPYTAIVLGEDIEALRKSTTTEVQNITRRFCMFHHVRVGIAALAFGLSLNNLANM